MANVRYVKWLLKVTVPADDHKITRVLPMNGPDDEVEILNEHVPKLNRDMRVLSVEKFEDQKKFNEALRAANTENVKQPGYKAPGKFDQQMTQEQVETVRASRKAALENARNRHKLPAPSPVADKKPAPTV